MKSTPPKIFLAGYLFFCSFFCSIPVSAQIAGDGTTSTEVTNDNNNFTINGGNQAGGNLFHSFQEFSVPTGGSANFNNAPNIDNIINRVTGGSISNIDGLLKANGNANLFLINPAGIIFRQNARLNIGGSFYGSTANSILFPDGVEFAANNLQPPILTINAPIGLNFRDNPGDIVVQGNGNGPRLSEELVNNQDGLQVNSDQTLALIGGNLTLEGATLITRGGTIELGSLEGNQQVSFTPFDGNFSLNYQGVDSFRDINLSQQTTVNTSSLMGGGKVQLQGRNIILNEKSAILSDTFGDFNGEGIDIQASETFQMADRAFISTSTIGQGRAGDLHIEAQKEIKLTGDDIANLDIFLDPEMFGEALFAPRADARELRENGGLFAASLGGQRGGDITMETGKLLVQNGFIVINSTIAEGGIGGNLEITASDSLELINSALFSTTVVNSAKAGNITIRTNKLRLEGVGGILTSTLSNSKAGGEINIYATESVELVGSTSNESIVAEGIQSGSVDKSSDAGNIFIETSQLILNRGQINTSSDGTGDGNGGDIMLKLDDNLVMGNDSIISAEASENANGGNIDIYAQFVIAFPSQDGGNDIITSAEEGKGGDIDITVEAVLGIREREESPLTNDINASSEFNQDGRINIRTPDVDATQGLIELPKAIIESETIVTQDCSYSRGSTGNSSFTIEGRGGVSPKLTAPLTNYAIYIEGEFVTSEAKQDKEQDIVTLVEREKPFIIDEIVPARGAIILDNGDVILTAYPTPNDALRNAFNSANCQTSPRDT